MVKWGLPLSRLFKVAGGFFLVGIGILGIILPVMPGWVFLIPGLVILGEEYSWARSLLKWAKAKMDRTKGSDHEG
jgi:uncharacterized membrane protein YbaN (DUF454 family)